MTFLHPGILWGLLAISVPIIIHFFNLQRPRQVLFSNVAFVREVKRSVVRRLKFKQWLLLLTRVLAISALVLAFASPVILGEDNRVLQGNRSIAVVLDNSYSMKAGNNKGEYEQQGISLARNILKAYGNQDEVLLMTSSDLKLNYNFATPEESLEELRGMEVRQNTRSHTEMLNFREEIFSRSSNTLRELYFLSDFQISTVMADSQQVVLNDTNLIIKYLPLATRPQQNAYVAQTQITSQIIEKDKPVQMTMTLVNDGEDAVNDLSVRVLLEGKVVAIDNKSLEANGSSSIDLAFTPTSSGWLSGFVELDNDPVDFDNKRYFSLYVPEKEKVLIVEGQSSRNIKVLYESVFDAFDPTIISTRSFASTQLNEYRSLVLVGMTEFSSGLADKLRSYLEGGGSLLFFPGKDMNLASVNAWMSSIQAGSFGPIQNIQTGSRASRVDLDHPLFEGIFSGNKNSREFDAPLVYQYHPFTPNNASVQNRILSLDNTQPILVESKVGDGILYTFTVFPGDAWTDFHVKTSFAPVIFRATQIMNQTQQVHSSQEIGAFEPKAVRAPRQELVSLVNGEGVEMKPLQRTQGGLTYLDFSQMELKEGNYILKQGEDLLEKISFNISDRESKLDFADLSSLQKQLNATGLGAIEVVEPDADDVASRIQVEKEGTPLWKYFLLLALGLFAVEVLILQLREQPATT